MADSSLINLIKSIKDNRPTSVQLHTQSGTLVQLDATFKESVAPNFFLVFPPAAIPEDLDSKYPVHLTVLDENEKPVVLTAKILGVVSDRSIEMAATKTINPASLREYFRVDLRTAITISHESMDARSSHNWTLKGQTIDLSGSGVLGLFAEEPKTQHNLFIDIRLTYPEKLIQCIGHVVRTVRLRGGRWQVALHYDTISGKDRDSIITNCLWEQRRQLRERVQTSES